MKYIKKFENFSTNLNENKFTDNLNDDEFELNRAIQKNPKELEEITKLVDSELSKFNENEKRDILENIELFSKKHNINLQKTSSLTKTVQDISKLSEEHELIYKQLLNKWKESQRALGKNTNPGQGTRNRLMKQAMQENFISSIYSGIKKGINFIDDFLEFMKYRLGMLSSIVSIIWTAISSYTGDFSWWQIVWFVISILYWRISSVQLAKQREFWGDDKKWYY